MGTLSKALVFLAAIPVGVIATVVGAMLIVRSDGPCQTPPCDGGAMFIAFSAFLIGPLVGLVLGYGAVKWFGSRESGQRK
jgi:hypothetical protein